MAPLHEAEHLARHAAHLQGFAVELALERIERLHDVADRAVAVRAGVRRLGLRRLLPHAEIGLAHHLLAEVHAHQVFLEDVVIEHVLGGFAEVHDPFADVRRLDAVCHVLRVDRAGAMVVAADAADAAGDEMSVARILALHEDAVAAEDRRGAMALSTTFTLARSRSSYRSRGCYDDAGDQGPSASRRARFSLPVP